MEILTNFGVQPTLLIGQIVNFLIILFLLKKFFFGKIVDALEDRKKRIEESLKNADTIELKLQETEEKSANIIEKAQSDAQKIITDAKANAQATLDAASAEAKKTIEATVLAAQKEIEAQKEKMKDELQEETLTLVAEVAKKVLGRNLKQTEKNAITKQAVIETSRKIL